MRLTPVAAIVAGALALISFCASAADWTAEYDKKIKASQNVGALGNDMAGDRVNFYTGSTSFSATDVSVPTNSMPLSISRSYTVESGHALAQASGGIGLPPINSGRLRPFGDWDLDVPHISAEMSQAQGWLIDTQEPTKRCEFLGKTNTWGVAAYGAPKPAAGTRGWQFTAIQYWNGYMLHTGSGEQSILAANVPNPQRPAVGSYQWTTNQNWWLSCIATANEAAGQGFEARSPDGSTYTFNWISRRNIGSVSDFEPELMQSQNPSILHRAEYLMLPTKIVDRFGNWTQYSWSNDAFARLLSVTTGSGSLTSPAEATITLSYNANGNVSNITDGTRTWTYGYATVNIPPTFQGSGGGYSYQTLRTVTLPGSGGSWQYYFDSLAGEARIPECTIDEEIDPNSPDYYWRCYGGGEIEPYDVGGSVIHPSGAQIDFAFKQRFQYSQSAERVYPVSLWQKTISGAGLTPATWTLNFWPSKEQAKALSQAMTPAGVMYSDELSPDQSVTRRVFGLSFALETLLLGELEGSIGANGGGSPAITSAGNWHLNPLDDVNVHTGVVPTWYRARVNNHVPLNSQTAYVEKVGTNPLLTDYMTQTYSSERRRPLASRNLIQQDVTFTTSHTAFDAYARATTSVRSSAGNAGGDGTLTESTAYRDNTSLWILGQVASVTIAGKVASATEFDAAEMPWKTYRFGVLQNTMTYNADGTLATVKDGLNNMIALSDWYRGVPRLINLPTGYSKKATVNPTGTVATTTNELNVVTGYGYDTTGRLTSVTYPSADSVAWNPLGRNLSFVPTAESGVPANHWKEVVDTGTGRTTTLYNARMLPVLTTTEDTAAAGTASVVVRKFDGMGREVLRSYPVAAAVATDTPPGISTLYDALGRAVQSRQDSELGVLTTTSEYLSGFKTKVTNPRSYATTTSYQVFDAPGTDSPVRIEAPEGVLTTITRDAFGKPLSITRSGPGN